tara:strand:- start:510 stop:1262 length:753 start_codon:yes stop_codon:yes gene_type:complete
MKERMKTIIIIPSRLSATRLPGKPLLKINGLSIISHVVKKAKDAKIGEVFVAAEDQEIIDDVHKNGGNAILTSKKHKTGTDRIHEALKKIDKPDVELIINLQGDEPLIDIDDIKNLYDQMVKTKSDLGTLASNISDEKLYQNENVVKVITKESFENSDFTEAVEFMRLYKDKPVSKKIYHHLGIYCYRLEILNNFVSYAQSKNEIKNRLEQCRALDNDIKIKVAYAKSTSIGVDTEEDFVAIKKIMEYKS